MYCSRFQGNYSNKTTSPVGMHSLRAHFQCNNLQFKLIFWSKNYFKIARRVPKLSLTFLPYFGRHVKKIKKPQHKLLIWRSKRSQMRPYLDFVFVSIYKGKSHTNLCFCVLFLVVLQQSNIII